MSVLTLPPQNIKRRQAKIDHYKEQADELMQTTHRLLLAYELVRPYNKDEASYYMDMYLWLSMHYMDYVMACSMTYIPKSYGS
jgi:hypothetical protein